MGIFNSAAEKATLEDLLKWVEAHKQLKRTYSVIPGTDSYAWGDETYIDYMELVKELHNRIDAADYD